MNVLLFGATGMVGQGVLRECLLDPNVELMLAIGRSPTNANHPKLRQLVHQDLWHYTSIENSLSGFNACFFCLGVSSGGVTADEYERLTYDLTLAAAEVLSRLIPHMNFRVRLGAPAPTALETGAAPGRGSREEPRTRCFASHSRRPTCFAPDHSAPARHNLQDEVIPPLLRPCQARSPAAPFPLSKSCAHNRTTWAGHVVGRPAQEAPSGAREHGYPSSGRPHARRRVSC